MTAQVQESLEEAITALAKYVAKNAEVISTSSLRDCAAAAKDLAEARAWLKSPAHAVK